MKNRSNQIKNDNIMRDELLGITTVYPGKYEILDNEYVNTLYVRDYDENRVQVIADGGGSYGVLFTGCIGKGLADATCEGPLDAAPNAYALYEVAKKIGSKKGVIFIANNYAGDFLNNDMALELLAVDGISARACYACDDIFSAKGEPRENRGGMSGVGVLVKIAACAAERGLSLDEVYRITQKANSRLCSLSALRNAATGDVEFGTGFSGEPPAHVYPYENADKMVSQALDFLLEELRPSASSKLYVTVNRMSRMTYTEGYGITYSIVRQLRERNIDVGGSVCGDYFDAFDDNGFILSLLDADEELQLYHRYVSGNGFTL